MYKIGLPSNLFYKSLAVHLLINKLSAAIGWWQCGQLRIRAYTRVYARSSVSAALYRYWSWSWKTSLVYVIVRTTWMAWCICIHTSAKTCLQAPQGCLKSFFTLLHKSDKPSPLTQWTGLVDCFTRDCKWNGSELYTRCVRSDPLY